MESSIAVSMQDAVAAEFDRLEIGYKRPKEDVFELPVGCEAGRFVVYMNVSSMELQVVVPRLLTVRSENEFKAIAMLNYDLVNFGRFGVDLGDDELRFDAEWHSPDAPDVAVAFARTAHLVALTLEVLQRVRFGDLQPVSALEAARANDSRRRAVTEAHTVAEAAWRARTDAV